MRRLLLFFFILIAVVELAQTQNACTLSSPRYCTVSDSLLDELWQQCLTMQPLDLTALKKEVDANQTISNQLNLETAQELERVFAKQDFIYGLKAEQTTPSADKLIDLATRAKALKLYHSSIWALYFAQIIYQYSFLHDQAVAIGNKAIDEFNSFPKNIQKQLKNKEHRLAEIYNANLLISLNEQQFNAAKKYFKGALYWGEQSYKLDNNIIMYARPLQRIAQYYTYTDQVDIKTTPMLEDRFTSSTTLETSIQLALEI